MTAKQAVALGNNANKVSPPLSEDQKRQQRRGKRHQMRQTLWGESSLPRCRKCGRTRRGDDVQVKGNGSRVGFAGVVTCGSVWVCPVCNAKIQHQRAQELTTAIAMWMVGSGGRVAFVTLTMRHERADGLGEHWDRLQDSWKKVQMARIWKKWQERLGACGSVRAVEVTDGKNGWHVHLHVLLFIQSLDDKKLLDFESWLSRKWVSAVRSFGGDATEANGVDVRAMESFSDERLAKYLSKATDHVSLGMELTHTQGKTARKSHSTFPHWQHLSDIRDVGDAEALARWTEFEQASKGRRALTWSRGLRKLLLAQDVEKTDEEIAEESAGDETLLTIPGEAWDALVADRPQIMPMILSAAEKGSQALRDFCDQNRISYYVSAA